MDGQIVERKFFLHRYNGTMVEARGQKAIKSMEDRDNRNWYRPVSNELGIKLQDDGIDFEVLQ